MNLSDSKKVLDKRRRVWYHNQVAASAVMNTLKKGLKKSLTTSSGCDILNKLLTAVRSEEKLRKDLKKVLDKRFTI